MKLRRMHWVGIIAGIIILISSTVSLLYYKQMNLFLFLLGISIGIIVLPFVMSIVFENKKEQEINEMFLEFSRNLAESVSTGTPISKSIVNMGKRNYGPLSPYIQKLANQISLGIPVGRSMQTFSNDVNNPVITRAVALISEAEKAGGEIAFILDSVAKSIAEIEKLKKERQAAIYNLVVQGYIIFFIFMGIILVMQFKIIPMTIGPGTLGELGTSGLGSGLSETTAQGTELSSQELTRPFLYLLLTQGFFAGLTIGKLTEGSVKSGIKHSFILTLVGYLSYTGANAFL